MKTLVLGGMRSGKSLLAETLATKSRLPVTYIATATADDEEMRRRVEAHRARRPAHWSVVEEPTMLATSLRNHGASERCVLVDCLTLWLANLLTTDDKTLFARERAALIALLPALAGEIIFVSNETNLGIIPMGDLSRRFCDEAGRLHQDLAQCCDRVVFVIAGLPSILKGAPL